MRDSTGDLPIVIFDGACGFCSRLVSLILRHERTEKLLFSPNSSPFAVELLTQDNLVNASPQTIIVMSGETTLVRSDAVVFIARHLRPPFSYLCFLEYVPKSIRDLGYRVVAASRRFLPGSRDVCSLLSPEQQSRIIFEKPVR